LMVSFIICKRHHPQTGTARSLNESIVYGR
jgi:hypothetical protein